MSIKLTEAQIKSLIEDAMEARTRSYSPYSNFEVGAALLTKSGKVYKGCNIENAGFTPTICAERTAVFKAVSEGEMEFEAIAVIGAPKGQVLTGDKNSGPCGVCRQVLREFAPHITIIGANNAEDYYVTTLTELLPKSFGPENLGK